jgi:hypothetical protein
MKLPLGVGAGAEITNCGTGSFLFTTDLRKLWEKILVDEDFFCTLLQFLSY